MSNIEQNLQNILTSRYGKDVRQSIHDSIHDCYEGEKKITGQIDDLGFTTILGDSVVDNLSYDGITGQEMQNAGIASTVKLRAYSRNIKTSEISSYYAMWDDTGKFIGRNATASQKEFKLPDNAYYVAIMFIKAQTSFDLAKKTEVWGITTPIGEFEKNTNKEIENIKKLLTPKIVTIKKEGGDYNSLKECFESISPSEKDKYVVEIYEGTYDLRADFDDDEWNDETRSFQGLFVPDYVTLKGVGDRKNIIITLSSDNQRGYVSTLNLQGTCTLENLTIIGTNLRYVIHDDFDSIDGKPCTRLVKDCTIRGKTLTLGCVYGSAVREGANWIFENVKFEISDSGAYGFRNHNWLNWTDKASIKFVNCRVGKLRLSTLSNNANGINTEVSLYGNKISELRLDEEDANLYGKGCLYKVTGFGNTVDNTNIVVTDGVDYASNVDLI